MTVSVTLIVKNEERVLGRCLDSIAGAVDEIVVVDTGSTDATKKLARRYTDRIFDFKWRQDFSAARQFAFDQATSDWVIWLDADDVVRHAEKIRSLVDAAPTSVDGFYWRYECDRDDWGNVVCEFWRERCVRNNGAFHWEGRVHEVLAQQRPCSLSRSAEVVVEHHRDPARMAEKAGRNLEILESEYKELRERSTKPSARLLFYLGSEYASAGESHKALFAYQQYLNCAAWDDERYLAQTRVAKLYRLEGRYEQAINADLQALKVCPHWPDAYFGLAESYYYQRDWHRVIHWTEMGRAMPQPETLHILNPMDYRFNWIIFYTNALFNLGETRPALEWTRRALEIKPNDEWHRQNFLYFTQAVEGDSAAGCQGVAEISPAPKELSQDRAPLRVVWEGPQFMRGSFGFVNRQMCSALLGINARSEAPREPQLPRDYSTETDGPLELSIIPHGPFEFGPEEDPSRFDALAARFNTSLSGTADFHVTMSYVPEPEQPREGKWIIIKPFEFSRMPREWFDLLENRADEVWVPSWFVWRCFVESGVSPDKVQVVPHGVNPQIFNSRARALRLQTNKSFKFLFLGGTIWRKGIDVLLEAYRRAFSRADDVCLVIKDLAADSFYGKHNARESIHQLQSDRIAPEVLYLTKDIADREVAGIYTACDCLIHPFRGEGFALPVIEAMACGLATIVTKGGPCDDYCSDETTYWIPARSKPAPWRPAAEPANVFEPDVDALIERLRYVFANRSEAQRKGATASKHILKNYTWEHAAEIAWARFRALRDEGSNSRLQCDYGVNRKNIVSSFGALAPVALTQER